MVNIPQEALKEYLKTGLFQMYDLTPESRVQHDKDMEEYRKNSVKQ